MAENTITISVWALLQELAKRAKGFIKTGEDNEYVYYKEKK